MITDELLFRFFHQETSSKENRMINDWLTNNPDQAYRVNQLKEIFESEGEVVSAKENEEDWIRLEARLAESTPIVRFRPSLSIRLARIAAILLIVAGTGLIWTFYSRTNVVSNKELIAKTIFLPDGTEVDLGPASKLVYDDKFMEGSREIKLTGDACFNVTSDPNHPFTVIAGSAKIKVTGTRFVVNAPQTSKEVEVSVKSGNVLFYNSEILDKNSFRMSLLAGEKGIFYPALNRMDKSRDPNFQTTP
jgi:ferric-dicitrate binding protein FerR (iron transport regulator)